MKQNLRKGVTLLELILVIAIIAILFAAIFVALDPARRLNESRNSRRWTDVGAIANAVAKYRIDNGGTHYTTVDALTPDDYAELGTGTSCTQGTNLAAVCDNSPTGSDACVDLASLGANYLSVIPFDPSTGDAVNTDYYIKVGNDGEIAVGSCGEEGEDAGGLGTAPTIEIIR